MPTKGPLKSVELKVNPILANLEIEEDDQRELVIIYGFIGRVSDDKIRFYQGLDLGSYFEISLDQIVYAEPLNNTEDSSMTKLVVFADADLKYYKSSSGIIKAGQFSVGIKQQNESIAQGASPGYSCDCQGSYPGERASQSVRNSPKSLSKRLCSMCPYATVCPQGCELSNGRCLCMMRTY